MRIELVVVPPSALYFVFGVPQRHKPVYKWLSEGECTRLRNLGKLDLSAERFDNELNRLIDAYQGRSDSVEDGVTFDTQYYAERRLLSGEAFDLLMSSHDFSSKEITILSTHLISYLHLFAANKKDGIQLRVKVDSRKGIPSN